MSTFIYWLFMNSLKGVILGIFATGIQYFWGNRISGKFLYVLWLIVVIRFIAPPFFESRMSIYNLFHLTTDASITESEYSKTADYSPAAYKFTYERSTANNSIGKESRISAVPLASHIKPTHAASISPKQPTIPKENSSIFPSFSSSSFYRILFYTWGVGAIICFLYTALKSLFLYRRYRMTSITANTRLNQLVTSCVRVMNIKKRITITHCPLADGPTLIGCFRPILVLPMNLTKQLNDEELSFVLMHELAHLKRGDLWSSWLIALVRSMHWFNPFVTYLFSNLYHAREEACDEVVLTYTGSQKNVAYANTILNFLKISCQHQRAAGTLSFFNHSKHHLRKRILKIKNFQNGTWRTTVPLITIVCLCTLPFMSDQTNAKSNPPVASSVIRHDVSPQMAENTQSPEHISNSNHSSKVNSKPHAISVAQSGDGSHKESSTIKPPPKEQNKTHTKTQSSKMESKAFTIKPEKLNYLNIPKNKSALNDFFHENGVEFPTGSNLKYHEKNQLLIVENTPREIVKTQKIVDVINSMEPQIHCIVDTYKIDENALNQLKGESHQGDWIQRLALSDKAELISSMEATISNKEECAIKAAVETYFPEDIAEHSLINVEPEQKLDEPKSPTILFPEFGETTSIGNTFRLTPTANLKSESISFDVSYQLCSTMQDTDNIELKKGWEAPLARYSCKKLVTVNNGKTGVLMNGLAGEYTNKANNQNNRYRIITLIKGTIQNPPKPPLCKFTSQSDLDKNSIKSSGEETDNADESQQFVLIQLKLIEINQDNIDELKKNKEPASMVKALDDLMKSRKATATLLSAPKIIVRDGVKGTVRMMSEKSYPTSWKKPQIVLKTETDFSYSPAMPIFDKPTQLGIVSTFMTTTIPDSEIIHLEVDTQLTKDLGQTSYRLEDIFFKGKLLSSKKTSVLRMPKTSRFSFHTRLDAQNDESILVGSWKSLVVRKDNGETIALENFLDSSHDTNSNWKDILFFWRDNEKKIELVNYFICAKATILDPEDPKYSHYLPIKKNMTQSKSKQKENR